ncbi:hypothetical protein [Virgibacillus salexigens]|uniref:hypothetical protein n=1 Tax=Virgibacillus salexigens TaxID=61016 RepID=UPI00190C883E|nr:hypothetical protein [Virgibacillus salexigens]
MMTLTEFHYKRYAQEYKEIDKEYEMHKIAFLIRNAAATKEVGTGKNKKEEYEFKNFKDFFDYKKALKEIDQIQQPNQEEINERVSPAQVAAQRNGKG